MGPRVIRVLAALSTLVVLGGGLFANRGIFLERNSAGWGWDWDEPVAAPRQIVVDAGEGVRVHVEGQTGHAAILWESRAWFAHADVIVTDSGISARCLAPTPVSRCAIWVSVTTANADDSVLIQQRPGALLGTMPPNVQVTVKEVP